MVTAKNTSITTTTTNMDFSTRSSKISFSNKATSEYYNVGRSEVATKFEKPKSEDFKDVLSSKANSKDEDIQKVNSNNNKTETNDVTKIKELKEKLKALEDDGKTVSNDDVNDILTQLLNLLTKLDIKEEDLKLNGKINSETLKNIIKGINENKSSNSNLNSIMEKLISEISNIPSNKQNGKILTLEDILKNYSQDNKEGSLGSEGNKSETSEAKNNNKEVSKEDKFLNSLIDDNKDISLNKINLFATRNQVAQNQGVDTARGLTINKATFADDLIKDVKFMSTNSLRELTVKVNPGDIGEITIKLIQEDGVMKANLKANSKEATALLSQNLADIKKQLSEQNIKIADVNIELYQEDTTFFMGQGSGRQLSEEQGRNNNGSKNNRNNSTVTEELIDNSASNDSNIEIFA